MRKTRLSAALVLGVAAVMTPLAAMAGPASAAPQPEHARRRWRRASTRRSCRAPRSSATRRPARRRPSRSSCASGTSASCRPRSMTASPEYLSVSQFASATARPGQHLRADQLPSALRHQDERLRRQRRRVGHRHRGRVRQRAVRDAEPVPRARAAGQPAGSARYPHRTCTAPPGAAAAVPALELRAGHPRAHATTVRTPTSAAHVNTSWSSRSRAARTLPRPAGLPNGVQPPVRTSPPTTGSTGLYSKGANGSGQTLGDRHPGRG